jgi:hypothetical protein
MPRNLLCMLHIFLASRSSILFSSFLCMCTCFLCFRSSHGLGSIPCMPFQFIICSLSSDMTELCDCVVKDYIRVKIIVVRGVFIGGGLR